MTFDTILQSMQELYSPTICTLILIILIVDTVIIVFAISIFLCDWFAKTVRGIVYRWKHRNDPPPKGGAFGIALGTLPKSAFIQLIEMEIAQSKARASRGESIFQAPGLPCYGCPELKDFFHEVRGCVTCPFKMAQDLREPREFKAKHEKEAK